MAVEIVGRACLRFDGAAGRRRAHGDACRRAGACGGRLLAGAAPRQNTRFTFGSGKFGDLAAFTSAVILGLIAFGVAFESVQRLLSPVAVHYAEALPIAALGLVVNVVSAMILHDAARPSRSRHGHHHDHNLRAAYVHVLADAATSVLAIVALAAGLLFGAALLDPLVGLIGAGVIASWSYGLIRDSGMVLLDAEDDPALARDIRAHDRRAR